MRHPVRIEGVCARMMSLKMVWSHFLGQTDRAWLDVELGLRMKHLPDLVDGCTNCESDQGVQTESLAANSTHSEGHRAYVRVAHPGLAVDCKCVYGACHHACF